MKSDDQRFSDIGADIRSIKDNHLAHIEKSLSDMSKDLTRNTTDTGWLKWLFMLIAGAVILGTVKLYWPS